MARPQSAIVLGSNKKRFINMIVYAHPGAGKTVLAGSSPKICILDGDNEGTQSAEVFGSKATVIPLQNYDDWAEAHDWLKFEAIPNKEFDWVSLDSVTLFQDRALIDDIMVEAHEQSPKQNRWVPSRREYLINMNRIGDITRLLVALPCNIMLTAHVMTSLDEEEELLYMPMIQGKGMPSKICGYMNVVGYLATSESGEKHRLFTQRKGPYYAKDRFHALRTRGSGYIEEPTLPMIEELVTAKRNQYQSGGSNGKTPVRRRSMTVKET